MNHVKFYLMNQLSKVSLAQNWKYFLVALIALPLMLSTSSCGKEENNAQYSLTDTFDDTRKGVRLILKYDAATESFIGTVENTKKRKAKKVRVEVHLSNGVELGPTTPNDMAPGEKRDVVLPAPGEVFTGWNAHAEQG